MLCCLKISMINFFFFLLNKLIINLDVDYITLKYIVKKLEKLILNNFNIYLDI